MSLSAWLIAGMLGCGGGVDAAKAPPGEAVPRLDADGSSLPAHWRCAGDPWPSHCFVEIPGARVRLGAQALDPAGPHYDPEATPSEGPVREVEVAPFALAYLEVGTADYRRCVQAGACREEDVAAGAEAWSRPELRDHAIGGLSWEGAQRFCAWVGGRPPTEAEWELAARGTDGRRWPGGNTPGCGTARRDAAGARLHEQDPGPCQHAGTLLPLDLVGASPFGLLGMAGNLWEWTSDAWAGPDGAPSALKVQRGGGYADKDPGDLRTTVRVGVAPDARLPDVGARCAWSPGKAP